MGRYSSDSEDEYKKTKKKKKRRSRSRSYSSDDSRKRSRKSKKSKKKSSRRYSRSRSRSSEKSYRRKRSRSRERRRSRSRSRSKSRSRRRSRSRSPVTRYRRSRSRQRSSSRSRRRSRSRSNSRSKSKKNRSRSRSADSKTSKAALENIDPCLSIPGFLEMSQAEKNEVRMKMAIKAAAATDAKLREQGVLATGQGIVSETLTYDKQRDRVKKVSDIDGGAFVQETFTSSRSQPKVTEQSVDGSHEAAIFNATSSIESLSKNIVYKSTGSLMGPIFYESADAKWDRWIEKVAEFRRKRLEGDAIS